MPGKKSSKKNSMVFDRIFNSRKLVSLILFVTVFTGIGAYLLSNSQAYELKVEASQYTLLNNYRTANNRPTLTISECLSKKAREWAQHMATNGQLAYSFSIDKNHLTTRDSSHYFDCGGSTIGENVGHGKSPDTIFEAWTQNARYKGTILSNSFKTVGLGAAKASDGSWWLVQAYTN